MIRRVLVVEDDPDSRDVLVRLVRSAGRLAHGVSTVGEALLLLEHAGEDDGASLPSHIMLDLMLPDAGGVVLLRSVRRRQLPVRIAVVSGAGAESMVFASAMHYQPDAVFHKPIDFSEVRAWLEGD